jgi:hypothetical protein
MMAGNGGVRRRHRREAPTMTALGARKRCRRVVERGALLPIEILQGAAESGKRGFALERTIDVDQG